MSKHITFTFHIYKWYEIFSILPNVNLFINDKIITLSWLIFDIDINYNNKKY